MIFLLNTNKDANDVSMWVKNGHWSTAEGNLKLVVDLIHRVEALYLEKLLI